MRVPIRVVTRDFSQFNHTDIMRGRVRAELELVFGSEPLGAGLLCLLDLGEVDTEDLPLAFQVSAPLEAPAEDATPEPTEAELAPFGRKKDGTPRKQRGRPAGATVNASKALDELDRQPV